MQLIKILERFNVYLTEEYVMDHDGLLVVKGENDQNVFNIDKFNEQDPLHLEKKQHEASVKSFNLYKR